jgi:hypothetical protein
LYIKDPALLSAIDILYEAACRAARESDRPWDIHDTAAVTLSFASYYLRHGEHAYRKVKGTSSCSNILNRWSQNKGH